MNAYLVAVKLLQLPLLDSVVVDADDVVDMDDTVEVVGVAVGVAADNGKEKSIVVVVDVSHRY
jgi:hypothetical protein